MERFFSEWKSKYEFSKDGEIGQFVPDGIVCNEKYGEGKFKVLFVLKDPNCGDLIEERIIKNPYSENGICDEVLESKTSNRTWLPIAAWTRALLYDSEFCENKKILIEDKEYDNDIDGSKKYFRRISIMNIKKAAGRGNINNEKVRDYGEKHREEIIKEIKMCDPDLIFACSPIVFDSLTQNVFQLKYKKETLKKVGLIKKYKHTEYGHCIELSKQLKMNKKVYLVEYRHPNQNCYSAIENYENMKRIKKFLEI